MNKDKLAKVLLMIAEFFSADFSQTKLTAYVTVLSDLTDEEMTRAFNTISRNSELKFMPTPGQIRKAAQPNLSSRDESIRRLTKIKEAITKFGWPSPIKAEEHLGAVIWKDIQRMGGWKHLCESPELNVHDPIIYAQMRDGLISSIQASRSGIDYEAQALNGGKNKVLNLIQNIVDKKTLLK